MKLSLLFFSFQESSASEVKSTASGVKYATLGGSSDAQRKKDAKKLEKEARYETHLILNDTEFY